MATLSPDSIPDVSEVREGLLHRLEAWRVPILAGAAVAVVGSLSLLAWSSVRKEREDALHAEMHAVVDDFRTGRGLFNPFAGEPDRDAAEEQAKKLEELRPRAEGTEVEAQILLLLAQRYMATGEDAKAIAAVEDLRARHPDSPVLRIQSFDSERSSLADRIATLCRRRREFLSKHAPVEPKPDPSLSALVETELGKMRIVFYPDLAPKHAEAFAATAKAGGFNGTRLYFSRRGDWIELGGGDRTRNADPRDDRDDDPALSLAPEDAARTGVKHRRRMVTSVPLLSGDQSDRFAVVLSEKRPEFDGVRTPFGELLGDESVATADRLGSALTYGQDAAWLGRNEAKDFPNTPSKPVLVRRVSLWKEGVLAEGHAWDTSRVNTDQPEPGQGEPEAPTAPPSGGEEKKPEGGAK